ncbi:MAG: hypothetical protein WCW52_08640 [Elusimicrobiales bacterium]|jgi:hypothetical protein
MITKHFALAAAILAAFSCGVSATETNFGRQTRKQMVVEALADAKRYMDLALNRNGNAIGDETPLYLRSFRTYNALIAGLREKLNGVPADSGVFVYDGDARGINSADDLDDENTDLPICLEHHGRDGRRPQAAVRGGKVYFCPGFFKKNRFERAGTFIHEFYHLRWDEVSNECGATEAQEFSLLMAGKYPQASPYLEDECPGLMGSIAYKFMANGNYEGDSPMRNEYQAGQTVKVARKVRVNELLDLAFEDGAFECLVNGMGLKSSSGSNSDFRILDMESSPAVMGGETTEITLENGGGRIQITCTIPAGIPLSSRQFRTIISGRQ